MSSFSPDILKSRSGMKISRTVWVHLAIIISAAGVVVHVGALFAGPSWFEFFGAPPSVVASARNGTWLAPVSGLVIAGLMGLCGVYAASATGLLRRYQRLKNIDDKKDAILSDLRISNDIAEMDIPVIHRFLANDSYWAKGLRLDTLTKSLSHSLCFGGFIGDSQVAFGRVVTDLASLGYLKDVFVLPSYRGRGYGKELVEAMLAKLDHEEVASLMLATQDAHSLYRKFGFEPVEGSVKLMRRVRK
jgi:GNAT superfamily N-acetyltransferase